MIHEHPCPFCLLSQEIISSSLLQQKHPPPPPPPPQPEFTSNPQHNFLSLSQKKNTSPLKKQNPN
jgi:hypothetical protein